MNKVLLMGRLTADPELKQTQNGIASVRFTVAVNRRYADKATGERQADFISCQAWRQTAEFVCKYFHKGDMIALDGELRTGSYKDRSHPDVTHYTTDVLVDNVEFTGSKNSSQQADTATQTGYAHTTPPNVQTAVPVDSGANTSNDLSYGSLSEFEEILSDGDVPF